MIARIDAGDFYILCPDNDVPRQLDERRMLWAASDIVENRPALSRWHPDYADAFAKFVKGEYVSYPRSRGEARDITDAGIARLSRAIELWWASSLSPAPQMRMAYCTHSREASLQRYLLVAALLADVFHAGSALFRLDAVWRAAFAADRLDPGVALFDDERLLFHRLADQALGLLAHRLLRHRPAPS